MTMEHDELCESCEREFLSWNPGIYASAQNDMRAVAAENLRKYNETMEKIVNQLDELLKAVRDSGISTQSIMAQLGDIGRTLIQKHGLCTDKNCAMCRVHEEAIKEHVLVYVDWRVPGTVQKLQQARHRN
ncbi:MAG: hypothetical protein VX966_08195 [Chloroflexota bacterium]|nr:hypothetical protein [Chloroflexota bacterium]